MTMRKKSTQKIMQHKPTNLIARLAVGDRRTTGASAHITQAILENPTLFDDVFDAMWQSDDAGVRMRAANVCETVSRTRPDLLQPRKRDLFKRVAPIPQQEIRWHVCQMLPRLKLTRKERIRANEIVRGYLDDKSSIVRTFALQAMADFAQQDTALLPETIALLQSFAETGTPAMRSRGKKLLQELK